MDENRYPLVSCIISTYQRGELLKRALRSLINQSFTDYEVICIHDGPADEGTKDAWREFVPEFERRGIAIMTTALSENSGYQCVPKNMGTCLARGTYVSYLDDDNEWTPNHLEVLVAAIEPFPQVDCVYGRRLYVTDDKLLDLPTGASSYIPWTEKAAVRLAKGPQHNFIDTGDALISKGSLWYLQARAGCMWDEDKRRFGDWVLFATGLLAGWRFKAVDEVVQVYHWHGANLQLTRPAQEWMVQKEVRP